MIKKKVTKRVQRPRPTALGRLMHFFRPSVSSTHTGSENGQTVSEEITVEPDDIMVRKREKKPKKTQEEEITEQIQEENVQQQEQIGENQ